MKKFFIFFTLIFTLWSCQDDEMNDTTLELKSEVTESAEIEYFGGDEITQELLDEAFEQNQIGTRSVLFKAKGTANEQYAHHGPYSVSTNAVVSDCNTLAGVAVEILQSIGILDTSIKCNDSFPYGFSSPISTSVYYPTEISKLGKLPVVNFVGGILSNQGNYVEMVRLWVSHGFIVVISSDFFNFMPEMHLLGMVELSRMNKNPNSPLYQKVDLSKMIVSGHSAGGQAALQVASIPQKMYHLIDPEINLVGALPIEPGPLVLGFTIKTPTLMLTGGADFIVPALTWPKLLQSNLIHSVPAWSATATTATHFSPVLKLANNEFAGITVAWLKYLAQNDPTAKSYFVGNNYKLSKDKQFYQGILNPLKVSRNSKAGNLR